MQGQVSLIYHSRKNTIHACRAPPPDRLRRSPCVREPSGEALPNRPPKRNNAEKLELLPALAPAICGKRRSTRCLSDHLGEPWEKASASLSCLNLQRRLFFFLGFSVA